MSDINTEFCRALLRAVMVDVKQHTNAAQRKSAWTYHFNGDHWEFHGPGGFYWHGSADNATHCRAQGWSAYLAAQGVEGYAQKDDADDLRTMPRETLEQKIAGLQNVQKQHPHDSNPWQDASAQLQPLFAEMARRQRAGELGGQ